MNKHTLESIAGGRKYIIIHNDLDGVLSWLFLAQRGFKLGGIYDMNDIHLEEGISLDDCFAVDIDLSLHGVPSIGRHFRLFWGEWDYNPNIVAGIANPVQFQTIHDYMRVPRFKMKCLLPTILILHYLTETPLPKDPFLRGWLIYTDCLFKCFDIYKGNVKSWLKEFGFESLIQDLTSPNREGILNEIRSFIQREGLRMSGRGFTISDKKPNPQCNFRPLELDLLIPFLQKLQKAIYQTDSIDIPDISTGMEGHFYQFHMNDLVYERIKQKYIEKEVISHGLVYSNIVNVTLKSPLDEIEDIDLLRARTSRCI